MPLNSKDKYEQIKEFARKLVEERRLYRLSAKEVAEISKLPVTTYRGVGEMSVKEKLLDLKEDIAFVKEGAKYSEPIIMREAYPSNPDLGEFSSVYRFVEVTLELVEKLEEIIEEESE